MNKADFGELYRRYAADVYRFALYLTGNRTDADDITAETFARAWSSPAEIRVGSVKAYLFMIARNANVDRHRGTRPLVALEDGVRDPGRNPEAAAIEREEIRALLEGLSKLGEADRSALLMRALGDLSYEAIAAALGVSPAAARVRVHRARLRLGELVGAGR
jgi:RNA polymerase sigma-70 factor, ECF subfamily